MFAGPVVLHVVPHQSATPAFAPCPYRRPPLLLNTVAAAEVVRKLLSYSLARPARESLYTGGCGFVLKPLLHTCSGIKAVLCC